METEVIEDIAMSEKITHDSLTKLAKTPKQICLSLYMPMHRRFPESEQDLIRYKNLLRDLRHALEARYPDAEHDKLMQPFERLLDDHDFWIHQGEGLVVLGGEHFFKVYTVQRPVPERIYVNDHPHLTPLMRIAQSAERYQVLYLARDDIRLFEGNRDELVEVELAPEVPRNQNQALGRDLTGKTQSGHPDGFAGADSRGDPYMHEAGGSGKQNEIDRDRERFFREIDRAIDEYHTKPSGLPLVLAALPENQSFFRAGSHNHLLMNEGINIDPGSLDLDTLRKRSWEIMSQHYKERLNNVLENYKVSQGTGLASDQLEEIGPATVSGRVATLLVEAGRTVPGKMDQESGAVNIGTTDTGAIDDRSANARENTGQNADLLDELIMHGMQTGGDVVVVPPELMPTKSGAAAVFRY
jgi:hypothetical protein